MYLNSRNTLYIVTAGLGEDRARAESRLVWEHSRTARRSVLRSVRKEKAVGKGVCHSCSPIRPVLCLFCGLAIEWGIGLLNELINVKRNILMVC